MHYTVGKTHKGEEREKSKLGWKDFIDEEQADNPRSWSDQRLML